MTKKIKIARIFSRYSGPAEYYLFDRMRMVDKERFETICIYLKKNSDEPNPLETEGFRCYYISNQNFFRVFNIVAIFKLAKVLRKEKIDILHCNRHQATIYGAVAAALAGVPVVLSHVHGLIRAKTFGRTLGYILLSKKISGFLACSNQVRKSILETYKNIKSEKVIELENSIDAKKFHNATVNVGQLRKSLNIREDDFVFVAVGRFVPKKCYKYLIEAFETVSKKHPSVKLIIAGNGRDQELTIEQIKNLGLTDRVILPGLRNDIPQILKASDCYVICSNSEGMPLALMEAMAAAKPCISTNTSGTDELIVDDSFGKLIEAENSIALTNAMEDYINLPKDKLTEIGTNASKRIFEHFNHDITVKKLEKIYNEMISKYK